ncbi:hypothetical protein DH2020_007588 [Rehmannia glutinosa]|uniref:Jasmonate O-methyltransferase n=1 Tax=Rehmannia glutinosa TaxID=99300 RepID=A0ABR0TYY2_REHGL
MGIADLGCSSGPNTLMVLSKIINTIHATCYEMGTPLPELRVSLNDLPGNDFNDIFMSLPGFYDMLGKEKGIGAEGCFISGVAGSFYGRLFPRKSLHFVHSSSSLHWLSQEVLRHQFPSSGHKGRNTSEQRKDIHIKDKPIFSSESISLSISERYFLISEIAGGGDGGGWADGAVVHGRSSPEGSAEMGSHQWELLAQALMSMALEGLVQEERIDSFNAPYYAPSAEEVRNVIEEEGSTIINHLESFEIGWDEGFSIDNSACVRHDCDELEKLSRGQRVAKSYKAVIESMVESHFGKGIMDELFFRYGELIDDYFNKTRAKHINLVISVTKI